jgi:predicted DNA-binding transcriptional regulator YafY
VQKIVDAINVRRLQDEEAVFPFIGFEQAPVTVGSEFLEPLVQAILNRRVIDLEYQSFRSEKPTHHILHPYYLKEYRNRWYLLAYHDHFREVWVYGLDRVKGLGVVHGKKFIETGFDITDYFRHHVGITRSGEEPEEILVAFSRPQANYIITQPLHESQEMVGEGDLGMPLNTSQKISKGEEGKVVFRYHLVPTFEFTSQLLGWGPAVEVISPEWLREEIVEGLTASLLNYTKGV